jgi:hypothetical protein
VGLDPARHPLFSGFSGGFLVTGDEAGDDEEGVGEQAQRDVAVPGLPPSHLVVVEAYLPFGLGEALFYGPTVLAETPSSSSTEVPSGP